MANIKEFRTPQVRCDVLHPHVVCVQSRPDCPGAWSNVHAKGLSAAAALQGVRSLTRFYLILFLPVFFGPYWSWVAEMTNFGFSFFFSILVWRPSHATCAAQTIAAARGTLHSKLVHKVCCRR